MSSAALVSSCTPPRVKETRHVYTMGEPVSVGALFFNVLETSWSTQIGELPDTRLAKHQFLMVRLSITNGGGTHTGYPFLTLLHDTIGKATEVDDAKNVKDWLGLIRMVNPGESDLGMIVFDVPQASYLLQLSDGKIENEQTALVSLPLRLA